MATIKITPTELKQVIEKIITESKKDKFFELLIKYFYEPKSRYPFNLWTMHKYIKNWADITYLDGYDKDGKELICTEPLDLENTEILSLTKDKLVFSACGDWQPKHVATIKLVNGKLTMTECRPYDKKKDKGPKPTKHEILRILNMEDDYKEKQKQYDDEKNNRIIDEYVEEYNEWNTEDGKTIGYKTPSESSVLEFIQNNHEQYNNDKKLQKQILKKLQDKTNLKENIEPQKLSLEQLKIKYPQMIFTLNPNPRFKDAYFARADIKKQDGTTEYLGALKGPVSLEIGLDFLNKEAKHNYDKYY